jgi:hypothetical protein
MKKLTLILIIVLIWISAAHAAPATATKFSANTDEIPLPINVDFDYEKLKKKKKITVEVSAILFKKPLIISDVRKAAKTKNEEINFLIDYWRVNIDGAPEDIVSFWLPEERAEKLALFKNAEAFSKNREYARENPGLQILGIIYQKTTISVLTPFTDVMALGITMKKIGNKYFLTDNPTNPLELRIVEVALKDKR